MTAFNLGIRERYITVNETSYGSGGTLASARVIGKDTRITQNWDQGFQETLNNGGNNRKVIERIKGPISLPYNVEFYPTDWRFLKYIFDITSESGSPTVTHTLDIGDSLQSFKAEWAKQNDDGNMVFTILGNVMTACTISFQKATGEGNDGFVNVNASTLAKSQTDGTSVQATITALTSEPFQYRMIKLTLAGNEVVEVNNGEITITQGVNPNDSRYANSTLDRTIGEPIPTVFRITGRFNLNIKDTTFTTMWDSATASLGGTNKLEFLRTAGSDEAVFTFTGLTINPAPIGNTNLESVDSADFVFTATSVQAVIKDTIANYD